MSGSGGNPVMRFAFVCVGVMVLMAAFTWPSIKGEVKGQLGLDLPAATTIQAGETATVRTTVLSSTPVYGTCYAKAAGGVSCAKVAVMKAPIEFAMKRIKLTGSCFVNRPPNNVGHIFAASTQGGGKYQVSLSSDMLEITICSAGGLKSSDVVLIWSNDSNARRLIP
jgi:hypothetical protein